MKKRTAKEILAVEPKMTISLRLSKPMIEFLDKSVKSTKSKNGTRSALMEGILLDWCKSEGFKE